MNLSGFWLVLSFSFVVALSGAMVPGPLFTYTIARTLQSRRRGFLTGLWVTGGHALLEALLVLALLLGVSKLLGSPTVIKTIGTLGSAILLYMGAALIRDVARKKVPEMVSSSGQSSASPAPEQKSSAVKLVNPVLGGALISMTNPYWWVWWVSVGFAFMIQYRISFRSWPLLLAFFLGHEVGDLAWYLAVSILVHWGKRRLSSRFYLAVLLVCGIFIIGFGIYLLVSIHLRY